LTLFGTNPCPSKPGLLFSRLAVLDNSSSSDSSNGGHQPKNKMQKRELLSYETAIASPLYRKYLKIADEDPDPTSSTSIYNDS
jgi:hypothetical protein